MNAARITEILVDCLFTQEEIDKNEHNGKFVKAEGITQTFGFHPGRLESHREEVRAMIDDLNPTFLPETGGGWSFLNLCQDKHGIQWGEHKNCEEFTVLCIALRLAEYQLPREMWRILPGGMPYIMFTKTELPDKDAEQVKQFKEDLKNVE